MKTLLRSAIAMVLVSLAACGGRDEVWDHHAEVNAALGLDGSVALIDAAAERALLLPVEDDLRVTPVSIPIGRGFAAAATTAEKDRLLVLARGDVPRRKATDQSPSLAVLSGGVDPKLSATFELSDPLSGLVIDPQSQFAITYAAGSDSAFVQNPNELFLVDLQKPPSKTNPTPITLRSFGGRPERFTFTPELSIPGGPRRLLVVQTDRDVALLDLAAIDKPDITVRLSTTGDKLRPVQVAVTDGEPDRDDDARLAIRLENQPNVILVDLLAQLPGSTSPHDFRPTPNMVFVGGTPTDLAFVRTDGGLRLAALVPGKQTLTLVDPSTGIASQVALGHAYDRMSLITSVVGAGSDGGDVALLWSSYSADIAFVALGSTVGKPYKSVEHLELGSPVASVIDVPPPNEHLKILVDPSGFELVVLDLLARTAAPIVTNAPTRVKTADDGARAWLLPQSSAQLGDLDLASLHPTSVPLSHALSDAFEVTRRDGGRALVVLHDTGAGAVTVLDAQEPSLETAVEYGGLLLEGVHDISEDSE